MVEGKRVLVTGAGGFIGSHLVERLLAGGAKVNALVRYNSHGSWGWLEQLPQGPRDNLEVIAGDIRDPFSVDRAVAGCQIVLHLAALIGIPYSYEAPEAYVQTNVTGTLNVLQAARRHDVEKVVVTSTSEVYGTARSVPITEEHPLQPQSPYSATKIAADQLALSYYNAFATPVAVARPFNTYGPRQSARAVIPTVITQIVAGQRELKLGALHPTRDFNFVTDTADGIIAVAVSQRACGEVINLGSNYEVSIGDLVELIASEMGQKVRIVTESQRLRPEKSEVERLWADNRRARELLDWQPEFGGIEGLRRGLVKTIAWFSEPDNAVRYKTDRYSI